LSCCATIEKFLPQVSFFFTVLYDPLPAKTQVFQNPALYKGRDRIFRGLRDTARHNPWAPQLKLQKGPHRQLALNSSCDTK